MKTNYYYYYYHHHHHHHVDRRRLLGPTLLRVPESKRVASEKEGTRERITWKCEKLMSTWWIHCNFSWEPNHEDHWVVDLVGKNWRFTFLAWKEFLLFLDVSWQWRRGQAVIVTSNTFRYTFSKLKLIVGLGTKYALSGSSGLSNSKTLAISAVVGCDILRLSARKATLCIVKFLIHCRVLYYCAITKWTRVSFSAP